MPAVKRSASEMNEDGLACPPRRTGAANDAGLLSPSSPIRPSVRLSPPSSPCGGRETSDRPAPVMLDSQASIFEHELDASQPITASPSAPLHDMPTYSYMHPLDAVLEEGRRRVLDDRPGSGLRVDEPVRAAKEVDRVGNKQAKRSRNRQWGSPRCDSGGLLVVPPSEWSESTIPEHSTIISGAACEKYKFNAWEIRERLRRLDVQGHNLYHLFAERDVEWLARHLHGGPARAAYHYNELERLWQSGEALWEDSEFVRPSDGRKLHRPVMSKPTKPKTECGDQTADEVDSPSKRIKLEPELNDEFL